MNLSELNPRQVMIAGDWHRNLTWGPAAVKEGCAALENSSPKVILQLGDFGIWSGEWGARYLRRLSRILVELDAWLVIIEGNHEDYGILMRLLAEHPGEEFIEIKERIWWATRGSRWTWQGKTWLALGGAVSVDAATRRQGVSWFPEEEITPVDAAKAILGGTADVMLTHDCPSGVHHSFATPPPWWDSRDLARSDRHRERLQGICELVKPSHLFHGHLHRAYTRKGSFGWGPCEVTGLNMEGDGNWIILDTMRLTWATPEEIKDPYPVVKGQVWIWGPGGDDVHCLAIRVAKDGSWADFRCRGSNGVPWGKRMKLPLPGSWHLTNEYVVP